VRLLVPLAALAVLLSARAALGASLSVGHQDASAGDWRAKLTFEQKSSLEYSDLHLTVLAGSRLVLDQPVTSSLRRVGNRLQPGGFFGRSSVSFRDLNGDGTKELLLALFTGGAHCCSIEQVFDFSGAKPRKAEFDFADSGAKLKLLDGKVVFVSADDSFAYRFTDYADSGAPIQLWAYRAGRFANVTRSHRRAIVADAAFWWKQYRAERSKHGDLRGILSAWAADEALLGRAAESKQTLLQIASGGALDQGFGAPKGSAYVRALWRFLAKQGYLR